MKESTKIYKARDIEKGVDRDPLEERFKKTKLQLLARLLAIFKTFELFFLSKCSTSNKKGLHSTHCLNHSD